MMLGNTPYVVSRAKARRQKLADRARLRQLINQSVDQLTVAVGDIGYRTEIDLYAGKLSGGDLVEAALTHNLEGELTEMVNMANRTIRPLIEIYTSRFEYQNAKAVFRAIHNEVSVEEVGNSILPEINDVNTPWLKVVESCDDMKSAAALMRRKSFGSALAKVPENGSWPTMKTHLTATTTLRHNGRCFSPREHLLGSCPGCLPQRSITKTSLTFWKPVRLVSPTNNW